MADRVEMRFGVVAPPNGIKNACKRCGTVFQSGVAMIEAQIVGDSGAYTVASKKKFVCCGEEKRGDELFVSAEEAESMIQTIERGMRENGSVQIPLNQWVRIQDDGSAKFLERPKEE